MEAPFDYQPCLRSFAHPIHWIPVSLSDSAFQHDDDNDDNAAHVDDGADADDDDDGTDIEPMGMDWL